jgi:hypothetical protein
MRSNANHLEESVKSNFVKSSRSRTSSCLWFSTTDSASVLTLESRLARLRPGSMALRKRGNSRLLIFDEMVRDLRYCVRTLVSAPSLL